MHQNHAEVVVLYGFDMGSVSSLVSARGEMWGYDSFSQNESDSDIPPCVNPDC